jgi:hypothetical protein
MRAGAAQIGERSFTKGRSPLKKLVSSFGPYFKSAGLHAVMQLNQHTIGLYIYVQYVLRLGYLYRAMLHQYPLKKEKRTTSDLISILSLPIVHT